MAGESPDRSERAKSSGETTEEHASVPPEDGAGEARAKDHANDQEPSAVSSRDDAAHGGESAGAGRQGGDERLKAAVAAWVAGSEESGGTGAERAGADRPREADSDAPGTPDAGETGASGSSGTSGGSGTRAGKSGTGEKPAGRSGAKSGTRSGTKPGARSGSRSAGKQESAEDGTSGNGSGEAGGEPGAATDGAGEASDQAPSSDLPVRKKPAGKPKSGSTESKSSPSKSSPSKSAASKSAASEATGSKSAASKSTASKTTGSKPAASKSAAKPAAKSSDESGAESAGTSTSTGTSASESAASSAESKARPKPPSKSRAQAKKQSPSETGAQPGAGTEPREQAGKQTGSTEPKRSGPESDDSTRMFGVVRKEELPAEGESSEAAAARRAERMTAAFFGTPKPDCGRESEKPEPAQESAPEPQSETDSEQQPEGEKPAAKGDQPTTTFRVPDRTGTPAGDEKSAGGEKSSEQGEGDEQPVDQPTTVFRSPAQDDAASDEEPKSGAQGEKRDPRIWRDESAGKDTDGSEKRDAQPESEPEADDATRVFRAVKPAAAASAAAATATAGGSDKADEAKEADRDGKTAGTSGTSGTAAEAKTGTEKPEADTDGAAKSGSVAAESEPTSGSAAAAATSGAAAGAAASKPKSDPESAEATSGSAKSEAAKAETAETESAKPDTAKSETAKSETAKPDTAKAEAAKAGTAETEAEEAGEEPASESESERTSQFVRLKSTDEARSPAKPKPAVPPRPSGKPHPQPDKDTSTGTGAGARTGAAAAASTPLPDETSVQPALSEAELTRQQPRPDQAPMDLLAQLTNTPPPPETPVRNAVRRVKIWTPLVALLAVLFVVAQTVRPLPGPDLTLTASPSYTFDGSSPSVPWPSEGQAVLQVDGLGSLGSYGEQKPVPIASVAKVMTAYVMLHEHPVKKGSNGQMIPVDKKAEKEAGLSAQNESTVDVKAGDKLSQKQALQAIMIASANNVARLIARWDAGSEAAFVKKMNATAKELGMKNTEYTDPSGLKHSTVSTAADQTKLAKKVMDDKLFRDVVRQPGYKDAKGKQQTNWNKLVPLDGVVGIKTGTTTKAGGNLMFAAEKNIGGTKQLIVGTMLGQYKPSILDTVIGESKKLIDTAQDSLQSRTVVKKGDVVGYVDDKMGGKTPVVATKDAPAVGWGGLKVKLGMSDGGKSIPHTGKAGDKVGDLTVGDGPGQVQVPVALQKDMQEPGFGAKLMRIL